MSHYNKYTYLYDEFGWHLSFSTFSFWIPDGTFKLFPVAATQSCITEHLDLFPIHLQVTQSLTKSSVHGLSVKQSISYLSDRFYKTFGLLYQEPNRVKLPQCSITIMGMFSVKSNLEI